MYITSIKENGYEFEKEQGDMHILDHLLEENGRHKFCNYNYL